MRRLQLRAAGERNHQGHSHRAGALWASLFIQKGKASWKQAATVTTSKSWSRSKSSRSWIFAWAIVGTQKFAGGRRRAGNKKFVFILHKNVFSQEEQEQEQYSTQKKQLIYDTRQGHGGAGRKAPEKGAKGAKGAREQGLVAGATEGQRRKSAYSCFLPANPITYLDFMVISTKPGSCRCSKDEGRGRGRGRGRTIGEKFCGVQFCILHLTCHCVCVCSAG